MTTRFLRWATGCVVALSAVACGGDDASETTTTIGTAGGTVVNDGAELEIPAGALTEDQAITIATTGESAPEGFSAGSFVYQFRPDGLIFTTPAVVRISSNDPQASIIWSQASGSGFDVLPSSVSAGVVEAQVQHFSRGFA